jgi:hypothetical protein
VAFALPQGATAATLLRWKLAAGDKFQARYEQQTSSTVMVAGKPANTSLDVNLDLHWQVEAVADMKATIRQSIERIDLKIHSPGADSIEFDTASQKKPVGPSRQLAATLTPLVGRKLSTVMTDRGEVLDNEPAGKPKEKPAIITPSGTPPPVSAEKLRRLSGQTLVVLPEKPVEKGDTWTAKSDIAGPLGIIKQEVKYTYVGPIERGGKMLEKIEFVAQFKPPEADKISSNLTVKEQVHSGTVYFDAPAGRVVEAEQSQKLVTETKYRDSTVIVELENSLHTTLAPQ